VDLDTGQKPTDMGDKTSQKKELIDPEPVGNTIDPECVQAGIAEDDFKDVAGGGVPLKDGVYIFAEVFEHGVHLEVR
jgi:hypothetical protein